MDQVFFGAWSDVSELVKDFSVRESDMAGVNVLFACYDTGDYEGDAFVLFERGGQLYEVHGGHCSCYGLEDQWGPEETNSAALRATVSAATYGIRNEHQVEILAALERYEARA